MLYGEAATADSAKGYQLFSFQPISSELAESAIDELDEPQFMTAQERANILSSAKGGGVAAYGVFQSAFPRF